MVEQHTHCQICGKAIPVTENVCSDECKQRFEAMAKKRKTYVYVMYALIFVILFLYFFSSGVF